MARKFQYQALAFLPLAGACVFQFGTFQTDAFQVCPEAEVAPDWLQPFSEPVRGKAFEVSSSDAGFAAVPITEVTVDSWLTSFEIPPRKADRRALAPVVYAPYVPAVAESTGDIFTLNVSWSKSKHTMLAPYEFWSTFTPAAVYPVINPWPDQLRSKSSIRTGAHDTFEVPANPTVSFGWDARWSEPLRSKPGIRAANQGFSFFEPSSTPTVSYSWNARLSEPRIVKSRQYQYYFEPPYQTPVVVYPTSQGWPDQFRAKSRQYQAYFEAPYQPPVVVVTYPTTNWPDQIRGKRGLPISQQQATTYFGIDNFFSVSMGGGTVTFNRNRTALYTNLAWSGFTPAAVVTPDYAWYQQFSEPVRGKAFEVSGSDAGFAAVPRVDDATVGSWYKPLGEPVRVKPGLKTNLQQFLAFVKHAPFGETITVDKWFEPLSQRLLSRSRHASLAASGLTYTPYAPAVAESTGDVFTLNVSWSKPRQTSLYPDFFWNPFTPAPVVVAYAPSQAWPDQIRSKRGLPAYEQQTTTFFGVQQFYASAMGGGSITFGKSFLYQSYAYSPYVAPTEIVTVDKWYRPLEQPVRTKVGLKTNIQPFLAFVKHDPFGETITVDKWFQPLSQRLLKKTVLQTATGEAPYAPPAEVVTVDKWYEPLSERLRSKPGLQTAAQDAFSAPETPTVSFGWYEGLSEPKRFKPRPADQPVLATQPYPVEIIYVDKWHSPLSAKPPPKKGLVAHQQQFLAIDPSALTQGEQIFEDKWHARWPDFAQRKKFHPSQNDGYSSVPYNIPAEIVTADKWYQWLSEPKRFKRGLRPDLQQALALVKAAPFGETVLEDKWHQPWSEPVRRKGIKTAQIAASGSPYQFDPVDQLNAILNATEAPDTAVFQLINDDTFVEANVSVIEIKPEQANTGIIADYTISETTIFFAGNAAFQGDAFQGDAFQVEVINITYSITSWNQANVSIIEISV